MKYTSSQYVFVVSAFLLTMLFALPAYAAIDNPLKPEVSTIPGFVEAALKALVLIALPLLTLFIVYSGFLFVSARGNSSKLEEAKKNFVYVIIGALLILGAWVLASLVGGTISQLTG